jgi:hypothetical protein
MCVGSPTAGTWSSSQWRRDNEFETDRHQILEIAFYIMRDGVTYEELGADYFNRRHAEKAVRRHVRQLEALGFHVTIEKAA